MPVNDCPQCLYEDVIGARFELQEKICLLCGVGVPGVDNDHLLVLLSVWCECSLRHRGITRLVPRVGVHRVTSPEDDQVCVVLCRTKRARRRTLLLSGKCTWSVTDVCCAVNERSGLFCKQNRLFNRFTRCRTPSVGHWALCSNKNLGSLRYRFVVRTFFELSVLPDHRLLDPLVQKRPHRLCPSELACLSYLCDLVILNCHLEVITETATERAYYVFYYWHICSSFLTPCTLPSVPSY